MQIDINSIITWYNKNNFKFPWRQNCYPYNIWISEIMLQQTQVKTVIPFYIKWIKKFPNINQLSQSNIDDILKTWEGLGYYRRAHNIYYTAQYIQHRFNGKFPEKYNELLQLKGIGDYTASAILSIAFNKPFPVVDGNIKRIFSRLYLIKEEKQLIKIAKTKISGYMKKYQPTDINQALMDFGREICSPAQPSCTICQLQTSCQAYIKNKVSQYPIKKTPKIKPIYNVIVGIIWKNNKLLISKRKKEKLLGGLWELPGGKKKSNEGIINCLKREITEELDITIDVGKKFGQVKHQYTHFTINLVGYHCHYKQGTPKPLSSTELRWIKFNQITDLAFPKSTLKLFNLYEKDFR